MPARQSILLLVLSALIALPAGVAKAEIDVDNGDTRVRIGDYGGITVERDDDYDYDSSYRYRRVPTRSTRVRAPQSRIERLRNLRYRYPRSTRSSQSCKGRAVSQQRTITSSSGSGSNRTYSSTTTTTCR
jgi:hypothetical protein